MKFSRLNLEEFSSLKIGPKVKFVEVKNVDEIKEVVKFAKSKAFKVHVLGEGTNSFFSNNLKEYLFIKLNFDTIEYSTKDASVFVHVGASVNWHTLVLDTIEKKLWGIENLSFIPGSVGAAPVQNIGAYGVELKDVFVSAKVFDTKLNKFKLLNNKACKFGYRDSIFKKHKNRYIIISVVLKLSSKPMPILTYKPLDSLKGVNPSIKEISSMIINIRKEKLPDYKLYPNCGSFFKNPIVNKSKLKSLQKKLSRYSIF